MLSNKHQNTNMNTISSGDIPNSPRSTRRTSWNPPGTLLEPWWNPRGTLPQGRPRAARSLSGLIDPKAFSWGKKKTGCPQKQYAHSLGPTLNHSTGRGGGNRRTGNYGGGTCEPLTMYACTFPILSRNPSFQETTQNPGETADF